MSVRAALKTLAEGKSLTRDESHAAFLDLMEGNASETQKGALLLGLAARGERPEEVAGAASALRAKMKRVVSRRSPLLDTCGTGGDGAATFNVSTAAALVCAGAGVAVAKHGNRSVSSRCGSADVLERLGVRLEKSREEAERELDELGFTFLFAPAFHPAVRQAAAVRKELGVPTIFNMIGPLANPAAASRQLIGTGRFETARLLAEALALLGSERSIVFHSENGLDELTPGVPAIGFEVRAGRSAPWRLDAGVLAQPPVGREELSGGDAAENAAILRGLLSGEPGPMREAVLLNAAVALWLCEKTETLNESFEIARGAVDSGAALSVLKRASRTP
jgi:anthranilate phosphoribosyltransferase